MPTPNSWKEGEGKEEKKMHIKYIVYTIYSVIHIVITDYSLVFTFEKK